MIDGLQVHVRRISMASPKAFPAAAIKNRWCHLDDSCGPLESRLVVQKARTPRQWPRQFMLASPDRSTLPCLVAKGSRGHIS